MVWLLLFILTSFSPTKSLSESPSPTSTPSATETMFSELCLANGTQTYYTKSGTEYCASIDQICVGGGFWINNNCPIRLEKDLCKELSTSDCCDESVEERRETLRDTRDTRVFSAKWACADPEATTPSLTLSTTARSTSKPTVLPNAYV